MPVGPFLETKVTIRGLDQVEEALAALPLEMQKIALSRGIRRGADVLKEGMARRAPRDPVIEGVTLAEEIGYVVTNLTLHPKRHKLSQDPAAWIGPSKKAFYGSFQERGTLHHPPQPFMRPTIDQDGQIAVAAFVAGCKDVFESIIRKVRRRTPPA